MSFRSRHLFQLGHSQQREKKMAPNLRPHPQICVGPQQAKRTQPATRNQDPIKSAQKDRLQRTEHSGGRRLGRLGTRRNLQRASHQDAPFSRSGSAMGVLRHNPGDQTRSGIDILSFGLLHSSRCEDGTCAWPRWGGCARLQTPPGSHRVHCVAVEALTIRSLARSSVQRSRHDAINLFFSSRYARLLWKLLLERDTSTACQRSKAVSLCVGSPGSISRSKRGLLSVCLFNAGQGASPGAAPAVDVGGGEACERIKLGCRLQRLSGSSDRSLGEFQPFLWRSPHCLEDGEPSITEPNVSARGEQLVSCWHGRFHAPPSSASTWNPTLPTLTRRPSSGQRQSSSMPRVQSAGIHHGTGGDNSASHGRDRKHVPSAGHLG